MKIHVASATVGKDGKISVPKDVMVKLKLQAGDKIVFTLVDGLMVVTGREVP